MINPKEFWRVRDLVAEELEKAFEGEDFISLIEPRPGLWFVWPEKRVSALIEEIHYWTYGVPGTGKGRLQVLAEYPYNGRERFRPRRPGDPFAKKEAEQASQTVLENAKIFSPYEYLWEKNAFLEGYLAAMNSGPENLMAVLEAKKEAIRSETFPHHGVSWDQFHASIKDLLKGKIEHSEAAHCGAVEAAEDWGLETGNTDPADVFPHYYDSPIPMGKKEWRSE